MDQVNNQEPTITQESINLNSPDQLVPPKTSQNIIGKKSFIQLFKFRVISILCSICITLALLFFLGKFIYDINSFLLFGANQIMEIFTVLLFIGYRIDIRKAVSRNYPIIIEILGLITGIYLATQFCALWFIILFSKGWSGSIFYLPFIIFTPLLSYIMLKLAQFLLSIKNKNYRPFNFRFLIVIVIIFSPLLIYSIYALIVLLWQFTFSRGIQNEVSLKSFTQVAQGDEYVFTGNIFIPQDGEYTIAPTLGDAHDTVSSGQLYIDGKPDISYSNNYNLTTGWHTFKYYPNDLACPTYTDTTKTQSNVTFKVRKVLMYGIETGQPYFITHQVICSELPGY